MSRRRRETVTVACAGTALLLVAALTAPGLIAEEHPDPGAWLLDEGPEVVEMVVTGLSCPFCAYGLEKRLRSEIEGLSGLEIEARTGKVTFRIPEGSTYTDEDLEEIVKKAGFAMRELERSPDSGEAGERTG